MIIPSVIAFNNFSVGPIGLPCIISEAHESMLEITDYPIENGANVSDHAFMRPKRLSLEIAAEDAAVTWNALVLFQESRIPFYMVTGLTIYSNMLIERLTAHRDIETSTILRGRAELKEVIIATTASAPVNGQSAGSTPSGTPGGDNSTGAANPEAGTLQKGDTAVSDVGNPATPDTTGGVSTSTPDNSTYLYDLINASGGN